MPTASPDMIKKLAQDAKAIEDALAKLATYLKATPGSTAKAPIETLSAQFDRVYPQVVKFARDAARSPKILCDEEEYKARRKDITKIATFVQKTAKAVAKEKKSASKNIEIACLSSAKRDFIGGSKKLAQALKIAAAGRGRTGPKEKGVKEYLHVHVGGNARENLLYRKNGPTALGIIPFHIESTNNDTQKKKVKDMAGASGGTVTLVIKEDDTIEEA